MTRKADRLARSQNLSTRILSHASVPSLAVGILSFALLLPCFASGCDAAAPFGGAALLDAENVSNGLGFTRSALANALSGIPLLVPGLCMAKGKLVAAWVSLVPVALLCVAPAYVYFNGFAGVSPTNYPVTVVSACILLANLLILAVCSVLARQEQRRG